MKRSRFTEEQIIGVLREVLEVLEAKRLRALEDENGKLKRLLADAGQCGSEGSAVKKMVTPAAKREAVVHLQALLDVNERRACQVVGADRTVIRYCF